MHTTERPTSTASGPPHLGDLIAQVLSLTGAVYVAGPPVLVAGAGAVLLPAIAVLARTTARASR